MEKIAYIYYGDRLFDKLVNFSCNDSINSLNSTESKLFNCIKSAPKKTISDIFLGWSFIVFKIGNKYYHAGFFNSEEGTTEVFKDCDKEFIITCGVNEVFAFSSKRDLLYYSTRNVYDIRSFPINQQPKIIDLQCTDKYSVILFHDGSVCLLDLLKKEYLLPFPVQSPISKIACGTEHVLFLAVSGQVFSYGSGSRGQLGHGTIENQDEPVILEALDGIKIKSISCGGWHSAAISDAGDLYTWGWNESGQLGFPCSQQYNPDLPLNEIETVCCFPKLVEFDEELQIKSVSCGTRHTVILTEDNEVWSWGLNDYGQLGHDTYWLCDKPRKVSLPDKFIPKMLKCAFWSTLISGSLSV